MTMNKQHYGVLKRRFLRYVKAHFDGQADTRANITMKLKHSIYVAREMEELAKSLGLDETRVTLAKALGLLHDMGRFEQYRRYKTFVDWVSVDHGALGAGLLEKENVLEGIDEGTRALIRWAVHHHNRPALEDNGDSDCLFYGRLIRDADKLDIYRVALLYYQNRIDIKHGLVEEQLPVSTGVCPRVTAALLDGRMVAVGDVKNHNDLILLRMGWVYDINFKPTFRRLRQRGYMEALYRLLPRTEMVNAVYEALQRHIDKQLALPQASA